MTIAPDQYDFTIYAGATFTLPLFYTDPYGNAIDLGSYTGAFAASGEPICDTPAINYTGSPNFLIEPAIGTCTITIAAPAVITINNNLLLNQGIKFTTTGALPTGITAGTIYYAVNVTSTSFNIAATPNGQPITTTGTQSGVHTVSQAGGILVTIPASTTSTLIGYDALTYSLTIAQGGIVTPLLIGTATISNAVK